MHIKVQIVAEKSSLNSDYRKILPTLKIQVDHIITDPPYNISGGRDIEIPGKSVVKKNFGDWDKFESKEKFLTFQREWLELALPKLKQGGSVVIFTAFEYGGFLMELLRELGLTVRNHSVWHKTNPPPNYENCDLPSCEYFIYATKGKNGTYNWLGGKKAHNFIETNLCQGSGRTSHTTQKPLEVMNWILEKYTNPGDLVLDPFAGSGSTGEACNQKGRDYVLIEEDKDYYEIMKMRLESLNE